MNMLLFTNDSLRNLHVVM